VRITDAGRQTLADMYLVDLWRKQAAADEWIEAFCDLVLKWKPIGWAEEQGQIKVVARVQLTFPVLFCYTERRSVSRNADLVHLQGLRIAKQCLGKRDNPVTR
jgi:hypothetical protein